MPEEQLRKKEPTNIHTLPCHSSNLARVGYDAESHILEVWFQGGGRYRYYDVPSKLWENLTHSESMGRYFMSSVRNAGFKCRKLPVLSSKPT